MSQQTITPRINASMVAQYINRPVRLVGTVMGYNDTNSIMQLQAADGGMVQVMVAVQNVGALWEAGRVVEVIGAAQGNAVPTIQEYTTIPFEKGFDLANYNSLVQLMNGKYASLFA